MRQTRESRRAKARQAAKLTGLREALIAAGCDTIAEQAAVLGLLRSTTWALLNSDKRAGPSAGVHQAHSFIAEASARRATKS